MNKIRTCLWFERDGYRAAEFYTALLPHSAMETRPENANGFIINFTLGGVPYQILNGGPHYQLNPACSIAIATPDQAETDRLWAALTSDGGKESRCGWLVDRWGVSWQIYPESLGDYIGSADQEAAGRAQAAMLEMNKIDIAKIKAAFEAQ